MWRTMYLHKQQLACWCQNDWDSSQEIEYLMLSCRPFYLPTSGKNTLNKVFNNIPDVYKATPLLHLGLSDQLSLSSVPPYTVWTAQVWTQDYNIGLFLCYRLECTVFTVGRDLEWHTAAVLSFINFCIESVCVFKTKCFKIKMFVRAV